MRYINRFYISQALRVSGKKWTTEPNHYGAGPNAAASVASA